MCECVFKGNRTQKKEKQEKAACDDGNCRRDYMEKIQTIMNYKKNTIVTHTLSPVLLEKIFVFPLLPAGQADT